MIGTFARFDIANFVIPVRRVIPAVLLVLAAVVAAPWPVIGIGAAALVMSLLAANPFAADERGNLDTLYATLPITRRGIVVGRYLALVVIYLVVALIATLAAIVATRAGSHAVDLAALAAINVAGFLIFSVSVAVQLPFFFSVGSTRARPMIFIPAAVVGGGAALAAQLGLFARVDVAALASTNLSILWVVAPVVAVAVLVASVAISAARYDQRAL